MCLEASKDRNWLVRVSATIYQHWQKKNARQHPSLRPPVPTYPFRTAESRASAIRPARAGDGVQRPRLWRGAWGRRKSPKSTKAVESVRLNRRFRFQAATAGARSAAFRFVILKRRRDDDGFLRIGAVNRLAVVPKRGLGEPFRHPDNLRAFRPSVAVTMQRHARHARPMATAAKPAGPVVGLKVWTGSGTRRRWSATAATPFPVPC